MNEGWVLLSRKLRKWRWVHRPEYVSFLVHCIMEANTQDYYFEHDNVPRGSFVTSISGFSKQIGITPQTCRTIIKNLCECGTITVKSTNKYTVITLCKFGSYQDYNSDTNKQLTNNQQTTNKQLTNNQQTTNNNITNNNKQLTINNNSLSKKNKFFSDDCDNTREAEISEISDSGVKPETLETPELEKEKSSAKKEKELSLLPCVVENKNLIKVGNESLDIVKFKNYFNEFAKRCGLAKIRDLTEERQEVLKARLKEVGKTGIMKVLENVSKSDFLLGRNERGWRADFDFIFRKSSFLQIWEGKYLTGQSLFKRETSKAAAAYNDELSEILHPELAERRKEIDNAITEQMWESETT